MNRLVDARGLACPGPVIKAKEAMKEMTGGILEILADEEAAAKNLMKLGEYSQLCPSLAREGEKDYRITFHMDNQNAGENGSQAAKTPGEAENVPEGGKIACPTDGRRRGLVAAIGSDKMGEGDEKLGHILMKSFLYALTKLEPLPETVLFYNGGARLTTAGSEAIEDIKCLEEMGVSILTCGTCLDFYGLSDRLMVGNVTNMYEIAETMAQASAVIKP